MWRIDPLRACFLRENPSKINLPYNKTHGISFLWLLSPTLFWRKSTSFQPFPQPKNPHLRVPGSSPSAPFRRGTKSSHNKSSAESTREWPQEPGLWSPAIWKKNKAEREKSSMGFLENGLFNDRGFGDFLWEPTWEIQKSCTKQQLKKGVVLENWKTETSLVVLVCGAFLNSWCANTVPKFNLKDFYSYFLLSIQEVVSFKILFHLEAFLFWGNQTCSSWHPYTRSPTSPLQSDFEPPVAHLSTKSRGVEALNTEASHRWILFQKKIGDI